MNGHDIVRRLRGAVGNALVWGAAWFAGALVVMAVLRILGFANSERAWIGVWKDAARFGVVGTIAGAAFSSFIGLWYRGRRLREISWVRFGIGGGIVTGLFVPTFIIVMRFLSGDSFLAVDALVRNGVVGAVFGGVAAAASLRLAQAGETLLPGRTSGSPDLLIAPDRLGQAAPRTARRGSVVKRSGARD